MGIGGFKVASTTNAMMNSQNPEWLGLCQGEEEEFEVLSNPSRRFLTIFWLLRGIRVVMSNSLQADNTWLIIRGFSSGLTGPVDFLSWGCNWFWLGFNPFTKHTATR